MKPHRFSPAHKTPLLAELVCSNSLRSNRMENAAGLLKEEMRLLDSLVMAAADMTSVPAGGALAVDRDQFAAAMEKTLTAHPLFSLTREEITAIPPGTIIIATGPLTSDALAAEIARRTGRDYLYFYDAISPIILRESIDMDKAFFASRYREGEGDYLNCPMTQEEYERFCKALREARTVPLHSFENAQCFEGCLPIEVMAERGANTLLFGPMKPVGVRNPHTGEAPYAVVQLRKENKEGTMFNMVGFQTKMTYPEQLRILRAIPGLEKAEFARYGSVHRNTYIHSPQLLHENLSLKTDPRVFFAGQISGVEGYVESASMGILAGLYVAAALMGKTIPPPPGTTALGSLARHITRPAHSAFQPMNVNFGLFDPLENRRIAKRYRGSHYAGRALQDMAKWIAVVRSLEPFLFSHTHT
jgi:methylenetetrahydrofolate--tRNA-(uracil-5-)-methyltransferase